MGSGDLKQTLEDQAAAARGASVELAYPQGARYPAHSVIFLAAWVDGMVWCLGLDTNYDPCAHMVYEDDAAAQACEPARIRR